MADLARTSRSQPAITRIAAPLVNAELTALEALLGGRDALVAALAHAPRSADLDYLLGIIADPAHREDPLADLCAQSGIPPGEVLVAYRDGILLRGQILAAKAIAGALPGVAAETMKLAAEYDEDCQTCQGLGEVTPEPTKREPNPSPKICPTCRGTLRVRVAGDLEHKKLALELGKLTSRGGGVNVAIDQRQAHLHAGGAAAGGTLEALLRATDQILYTGGKVLPPERGGGGPGTAPPGEGDPQAADPIEQAADPIEAELIAADPPLAPPLEDLEDPSDVDTD